MSAASRSRGSRRFVSAGALFLVAWQLATIAGAPRETGVSLGVLGFVLHTVFGKGYSLIPTYFDRDLKFVRGPVVQLPLTAAGAVCLALAPVAGIPSVAGVVGAVLWALGVAVFCGTIVWTVRDNLSGRETGTGEANADRRPVDRVANAFVPVALGYLLVGSYELLAIRADLPALVGGYAPGASHLLAAGCAALLLFAVGFRLFPRFLVTSPPRALVGLVLPAGAIGPAVLASSLWGGQRFRVGAALEAVAVAGFAVSFFILYRRSERRRVGFYGVLLGSLCGILGVGLGVDFALGQATGPLLWAHYRLNVLGFLGVTIVGVAFQFYPPAVGTFRAASDRTAGLCIGSLGGGVLLEAAGLAIDAPILVLGGRVGSAFGSVLYAYLIFGLFSERYGDR
jgi:hypothetical protein